MSKWTGIPNVPEDWELVDSGGARPFESWAIFRRPDGSEYLWESRNHRKVAGQGAASGFMSGKDSRMYWAPRWLSWWGAIVLAIGSACFVLGAAGSLLPGLFGGTGGAAVFEQSSYLVGTLLLTVSTYILIMESINASDYIDESSQEGAKQSFRWFAWQPYRLAFVSPFLLFVGSNILNVDTALALGAALKWVPMSLTGWLGLAGTMLFVVGSYTYLIEVCHGYPLCWQPRSLEWWVTMLFLIGSVLIVVGFVALFGLPLLPVAVEELVVAFTFLVAGVCWTVAGYLMLREYFAG